MDVVRSVTGLVDAWCDRRCLGALRRVLQGWPLASGLTDDWAQLLEVLKAVRAEAANELTEDEQRSVDALVGEVERIVFRR
jgi:hypothetical protein